MAGSRYHRTGKRYRTAKQRAQLKKAQLVSARKRSARKKVGKRVVIGLASATAVAGIGYATNKKYPAVRSIRNVKSRVAKLPYAKMTSDLTNQRKTIIKERAKVQKEIKRLQRNKEWVERNRARRLNPTQRAESKKRRADYLNDYNARRRAAYRANASVGHGVRPRKKRAKETQPRKRKTD